MAFIDYETEYGTVSRDTNVYGANVYIENGQGCGTIWFNTVAQAKKALKADGIKRGSDLADCTKCSCHYSYGTKEHKKYPEYLCRDAKLKYAKQFTYKKTKKQAAIDKEIKRYFKEIVKSNKVVFESEVSPKDLMSLEVQIRTGLKIRMRAKTNFTVYEVLEAN